MPAKISGYVFQDGPTIVVKQGDPAPNIPAIRDGKLTPDDTRLSGVVLQLCDGSGYPLTDANGNHITTDDRRQRLLRVHDAPAGRVFGRGDPAQRLRARHRHRRQQGRPGRQHLFQARRSVMSTLAVDPSGSAIVQIPIDPGDAAVQYNFSEVLINAAVESAAGSAAASPPPTPTPIPPPPVAPPYVEYQPVGLPYYLVPRSRACSRCSAAAGGPGGYTWHLSIIDAGQPRSENSGNEFAQAADNTLFDPVSWTGADLEQSQWILADQDGTPIKTIHFGMPGATPVTGDWDGSGTTKIGVFIDGLWFLDLNGNGVWDQGDLWVKLGKKGDQPVTGDWNGDGKTDIGIFGPTWIGDVKAIAVEPGLPDSLNPPTSSRPKNVPPDPADAAVG